MAARRGAATPLTRAMREDVAEIRRLAERTFQETTTTTPIPIYDEERESFQTFCRRLNDYLNAKRADVNDAKRILPTTLRGSARDAFEKLPANFINTAEWDDLLNALLTHICTDDKKLLAQAEIATLKQGALTVDKFARICKEMAMKAYPNPQEQAAMDAVLLSTFVNGLRPEVRAQVRRSRPANFEAAKIAAIHEEALNNLDSGDNAALREAISSLTEEVHHLSVSQNDTRNNSYRHEAPSDGYQHHPRNDARQPWRRDDSRPNRQGSGPGFRNRTPGRGQGDRRDQGRYRSPGPRESRGFRNPRDNNRQGFRSDNRRNFPSRERNQERNNGTRHWINAIFDPMTAPEAPTTRGGPSINTTILMLCAIVAACLFPGALASPVQPSSAAYYNCRPSRGGILVVPPSPESCTPPEAEQISHINITLYVHNATIEEHSAYKCIIRHYKDCTNGTVLIPSYNRTFLRNEAPSASECWEAYRERVFGRTGATLRKTMPNVYDTKLEDKHPGLQWWGEECNPNTRMTVEKGSLATLSDGTIITSLMLNTNGCKAEDGVCGTNSSIVVWKPPPVEDPCKYIKLGDFEAKIGGDTLIIEAIESAFTVDTTPTPHYVSKCFEQSSYRTKSGTVFTTAQPLKDLKPRTRRSTPEQIRLIGIPHIRHLGIVSSSDNVTQSFYDSLKNERGHKADTRLAEILGVNIGEAITSWNIRIEDVERRIRWYDFCDTDTIILHTLAEYEILLTTYTAIYNLKQPRLVQLIRDCEEERNEDRRWRISLPERDTDGTRLIAMLCSLRSIGPGARNPTHIIDQHIFQRMPSACRRRLTPRKENDVERQLSEAKLTLAKMNTLFMEELTSIERILAGKSGKAAKEITDWYRNLASAWDDKEGTATTTTTTATTMTTTGSTTTPRMTTTKAPRRTSTTTTSVGDYVNKAPPAPATTKAKPGQAPPFLIARSNVEPQERPSRSTSEEPVSSVGSKAHVEFMKTAYDKEENARREMSANHLNHKLQYTAEMIQEDLKKNFNKVFEQICNIQNRQLETWWALLRIDATTGMRTILRRDDVIAQFVGYRVLSVTQCNRINVTHIYTDHAVNGTCYTNTPVSTEEGQLMFIIPGSHDLINTSPTVDCSAVSQHVWMKTDGTWTSSSGKANITILPGFGQHMGATFKRLSFTGGDTYIEAKGSGDRHRKTYAKQHRTGFRNVKIGDEVLVRRNQPRNKLSPYLHGPYKVIEVKGSQVYYKDGRKTKIAHKDHVRIFKRLQERGTELEGETAHERETERQEEAEREEETTQEEGELGKENEPEQLRKKRSNKRIQETENKGNREKPTCTRSEKGDRNRSDEARTEATGDTATADKQNGHLIAEGQYEARAKETPTEDNNEAENPEYPRRSKRTRKPINRYRQH